MRTKSVTCILPLCMTLALASCDSQASPEYVGEALITLRGSVKIEDPPKGALKPALAFFNGETGTVRIVDVAVEGEFPSDFTLRVTEPPPKDAYFEGPAGIRSALGYVTAVTAGHPDSFRYATQSTGSATCYNTDAEGIGYICDTQRWWCSGSGDEQQCYGESERCAGADDDKEDEPCEVIETVGDPALKDTWSNFAGLSENLVLVYLAEPLAADHADAVRLGLPGLDAGYAVLEPQPKHDPDSEDGVACDELITQRAAELHAEKYQTGLTYDELLAQGGCGGENKDEWIPCDPRRNEIWEQIQKEFEPIAAAEIGCRQTGTWRVVDEAEREHVSIRIGTGVQPTLYSPDRVSQTEGFTGSLELGAEGPSGLTPFDPCGEPEVEPVAWDEASPTGQSPEALFGPLEAGCTSTLVWNGSESERRVTPSSGSTEITVELRLDRASARYQRHPMALQPECGADQLLIDGQLTLRTADGAIDDTSAVTLVNGLGIFATRPIGEHGGTLDVEHEDTEILFIEYNLGGAGENCTGTVSYFRQMGVELDGTPFGVGGGIGSWSNNGCEWGGERIEPADPIDGVGASPLELAQRMFGDVERAGHWTGDGSDARLQLSAAIATDGAICKYGDFVIVPAAITYGTSDGVIAEHVAEGELDLDWRDREHPTGQLSMRDGQECESTSASLRYTPADCGELLGVTVGTQLRYDNDVIKAYENALYVYSFERGGVLGHFGVGVEVESADSRRTLQLEP